LGGSAPLQAAAAVLQVYNVSFASSFFVEHYPMSQYKYSENLKPARNFDIITVGV
jgi:hypothetical protein